MFEDQNEVMNVCDVIEQITTNLNTYKDDLQQIKQNLFSKH